MRTATPASAAELSSEDTMPILSPQQRNYYLEGVTLEAIMISLQQDYGWEALAARLPFRCFEHNPSIASSLAFLRKTPWARSKVETLYCQCQQAKKLASG
jgi:uncharacterized protein (DUF2132 family)